MTEPRFEQLMRDAAHTYNPPPDAPLDEMWPAIEARLPAGRADPVDGAFRRRLVGRGASRWPGGWLQAAAILLVGIGIGRFTVTRDAGEPLEEANLDVEFALPDAAAGGTGQYLDRAAALVTALPVVLSGATLDPRFVPRARDLLLQTRWLLDSPDLSDASLQVLLEDLEIVLAQVVRLEADRDPLMLDLLAESLEQRDVLPRLRIAVADHGTD